MISCSQHYIYFLYMYRAAVSIYMYVHKYLVLSTYSGKRDDADKLHDVHANMET